MIKSAASSDSQGDRLRCLRCCCAQDISRKVSLIVFVSILHFFSLGITFVALKLLINQRIAGEADDPNEASLFVDTTNTVLYAVSSFLCSRCTSGLGDYVGRKPLLLMASSVSILTRLIYLGSTTPAGFYIAAVIGGALDCFYFTALAWVCDFCPEAGLRHKWCGVYIGLGSGVTLAVAAPLGAVLASTRGPSLPFVISPFFSAACIVCLLLFPIEDTLGVRGEGPVSSGGCGCAGRRRLPGDWADYAATHFPVSAGSLQLIAAAKHPLDWLTYFLMVSITAMLGMVMVQFALGVFGWSALVATGAVLSVGMTMGVTSPALLSVFRPVPLALRAMCVFSAGLLLMSAAGTGAAAGPSVGIAGIICIAAGTSWIPSLQSNLLRQYGPESQGAASGLLSQCKDLANVPGYIMSLGFTFSMRARGEGGVYWPGSAFAAATIVCVAAIAVHWRVYRQEALELGFRTSDVRTDGATGGSLEMEEGREVRHTVNSPAGDQEQRGASDA